MTRIALLLCLLTAAFAQDFQSTLNQGVAAFRNAKYDLAVELFRRAVQMDPNSAVAGQYLATAYMTQWIPGSKSPANQSLYDNAEAEFRRVLDRDPSNKVALASLASLTYNAAQALPPDQKSAQFDIANSWYQRIVTVDPNNKEAYYSMGVIAWAKFYPALMTARSNLHMRPETPGPLADPQVRGALQSQFSVVIEDGIASLNRALAIDPQYDDAMAYLNLLIRERADLRSTATEYAADVAVADQWVQRALDTKKLKGGGGLQNAQSFPAPPPPASVGGAPTRIRVGGNVQQVNLIKKVSPAYPQEAKEARVQGTVRYTVLIAKDGTVANIQLISGHPLLVPVSTEAVKQWVYKPTLLNGEPVEVITQVDVNFTLTQ